MGFRFRKSFKILPGVRINLTKSGMSTSVGVPGATVNFSNKGTRTTAGVPGTGISYSQYQSNRPHAPQQTVETNSQRQGPGTRTGLILLIVLTLLICILYVSLH